MGSETTPAASEGVLVLDGTAVTWRDPVVAAALGHTSELGAARP